MSTPRLLLCTGLLGALAVLLGAFGAHLLAPRLPPERLQVFETAVRYHFHHTLALGLCALLNRHERLWAAPFCFLSGMLLFSGSLYLLVATDWTWLGAITPVGGLLLVAGWLALAFGFRPSTP